MSDAQLIREIIQGRRAWRAWVRRLVLEDGRLDILLTEILQYECRPFHLDLLRFQEQHRECLCLAPRGYGKSTVLTIGRVILEVLRNPNVRILIASKTALQAEVFLREIKLHLESNQRLLAVFGPQAGAKWDLREIDVAGKTAPWKESTITTVGVGGPVASRHYDLILGDDLVDEKNARTDVQRDHVRTWYLKTLYPTVVDSTSRVWLCGTRYHPLDLYDHLTKVTELPTKIVRALEADGSTPWPEKFSVEHLGKLRQKMGTAIFASQYQNDTEAMKGTIFKEEWLRFYREWPQRKDPDGKTLVRGDGRLYAPWEGFDGYGGCDPAATKQNVILSGRKADSDWWTIAVAYREREADGGYGSRLYFRYLWRARCSKDEYVRKVASIHWMLEPRPLVMGVESVAAQEYLVQDLMKAGVPVQPIERHTDKVSRAFGMQAYFENGQVWFPSPELQDACGGQEVWGALIEELLLFPDASHDDLLDCVENCVSLGYGAGQTDVVVYG